MEPGALWVCRSSLMARAFLVKVLARGKALEVRKEVGAARRWAGLCFWQ